MKRDAVTTRMQEPRYTGSVLATGNTQFSLTYRGGEVSYSKPAYKNLQLLAQPDRFLWQSTF